MHGGKDRYPDDEGQQIAYNDGWMDSTIHHKFKSFSHEDGMILGLLLGFLAGAVSVFAFFFATDGAACNFLQSNRPWTVIQQPRSLKDSTGMSPRYSP